MGFFKIRICYNDVLIVIIRLGLMKYIHSPTIRCPFRSLVLKDLNSTVAKRGSVFIGLMTPDGAIWFRYQRAFLMR